MKLKPGLFAFAWIAMYFLPLTAQRYPTGLLFDDDAYNALPSLPVFSGLNYMGNIPLIASLKDFAPNAGHQKKLPTCVGWATGYGAHTIAWAKMNGVTDKNWISSEAFSALYVYNNIKETCSNGINITKACEFLKSSGNLRSEEFDTDPNDCDRTANQYEKLKALQFRIKDFVKLFDIDAESDTKIFAIKKSIAAGNPVIVAMEILKNFHAFKGDGIYDPRIGNKAADGGHAMCVVGYDEYRRAFEILNSWGTGWGNNGYAWIKYEDFTSACRYAFTLILDEKNVPEQPLVKLQGDFLFRYPIIDYSLTFGRTFKEAKTKKNQGYSYSTEYEDWKIGDMLQLVVKNMRPNEYVYVASIDGNGVTYQHWPKVDRLGNRLSSLVPYSDAEIVIPGENLALVKDVSGDDYLVILYSDQVLTDFNVILDTLRDSQDDVERRILEILGTRVPPAYSIQYEPDRMAFNAEVKAGSVVPIILKAKGR